MTNTRARAVAAVQRHAELVRRTADAQAKRDALLAQLVAEGYSLREVAQAVGVSHELVRRAVDRQPNQEESK